MKIRKSISEAGEMVVFIYENKKEEYFVIAIPEVEWSYRFSYTDDASKARIQESLKRVVPDSEAEILANRINQWSSEM